MHVLWNIVLVLKRKLQDMLVSVKVNSRQSAGELLFQDLYSIMMMIKRTHSKRSVGKILLTLQSHLFDSID